jgi:Sporulation and spore germination
VIPRNLIITAVLMFAVAVGMGVYVWHMRGRAANQPSADTRPVAPPVSGPTEQVTLYVAYDDPGVLRAQSARIPLPAGRQERAQELLRALIGVYVDKSSPHPLPAAAEVRHVYLVDPGLAVIDTNAAFADDHRSGVLVEELTVASLVETLATNIPGVTRVRILVDGASRDTLAGHVDLSTFFDVADVNRMVAALDQGQ